MFRSLPNISLIRPADEVEMLAAWNKAINEKQKPTIILATRQNIVSSLPTQPNVSPYYLLKNNSKWALISTGSELSTAYRIGKELNINVISAPDLMRNKLNFDSNYTISLEAGSTFGWAKFAKYNIGVDQFGFSAPIEAIQKRLKLDKDSVYKQVLKIMKKN
jgi:transketolase